MLPNARAEEQSLTPRPEQFEEWNTRGIEHFRSGRVLEARQAFDRALELEPASPRALNNRGLVRQAQGDGIGALSDFDRALELAPEYRDALCNRAVAYRSLGKLDEALADLNQVLALDPETDAAAVYNERAALHVERRDFAAAEADCDEAIRLQPTSAALYVSRAHARYHRRDLDSVFDYVRAFEIDPAVATREILGALREHVRQDAPLVLANCAKHLRRNPEDVTALLRRGLTLVLIGRAGEAAADFEQATDRLPEHRHWLTMLLGAVRPEWPDQAVGDTSFEGSNQDVIDSVFASSW
jgi:tetratricopeptide (TPR) repeat protein